MEGYQEDEDLDYDLDNYVFGGDGQEISAAAMESRLRRFTFGINKMPTYLWPADAEDDDDVELTYSTFKGSLPPLKPPAYPKRVLDTLILLTALQSDARFANLSEEELTALTDAMSETRIPTGAVIHEEDQPAGDVLQLFIVVEGQCNSTRNSKLLDTIGPGDTLGSHAVASNKLFNSTVQATCDTRAFTLSNKMYHRIISTLAAQRNKLYLECLLQTLLAQHLSRMELRKLIDVMDRKTVLPKEYLLKEEVECTALYVVLDGDLLLTQKNSLGLDEAFCFVSGLCVVGEAPFLTGEMPSIACQAMTEVTVARLERRVFEAMFGTTGNWLREKLRTAPAYALENAPSCIRVRVIGENRHGLTCLTEIEMPNRPVRKIPAFKGAMRSMSGPQARCSLPELKNSLPFAGSAASLAAMAPLANHQINHRLEFPSMVRTGLYSDAGTVDIDPVATVIGPLRAKPLLGMHKAGISETPRSMKAPVTTVPTPQSTLVALKGKRPIVSNGNPDPVEAVVAVNVGAAPKNQKGKTPTFANVPDDVDEADKEAKPKKARRRPTKFVFQVPADDEEEEDSEEPQPAPSSQTKVADSEAKPSKPKRRPTKFVFHAPVDDDDDDDEHEDSEASASSAKPKSKPKKKVVVKAIVENEGSGQSSKKPKRRATEFVVHMPPDSEEEDDSSEGRQPSNPEPRPQGSGTTKPPRRPTKFVFEMPEPDESDDEDHHVGVLSWIMGSLMNGGALMDAARSSSDTESKSSLTSLPPAIGRPSSLKTQAKESKQATVSFNPVTTASDGSMEEAKHVASS
eukprot:GGOE01007999.1.p1 GENE.GGOE01007999.1~~GGOE01007999.1.p1  ORF type:complete len:798 (-),score=207.17 GGOE01007999.1:1228-3621(-)